MRYSLRMKLFITISGIIVFYVFLSWLLNSLLLEKYYLYSKKKILIESREQVENVYKTAEDDIPLELEKLENIKGLHIVIMDKNFEIKYNSMQREWEPRPRRIVRINPTDSQNSYENLIKSQAEQISSGKIIIESRRDSRLNTNFISLFSVLYNGDFLFLSTPVEPIRESANIANNFVLFTGLITILTGTLLVLSITGRFTRPILELKNIAQRMSTLDFSRRYHVKTKDEIGELGESINSLSEQLQKSILELNETNRRLQEDIRKEREIDEMRKEFVSNVSHELKTPIALIQGYAEGLKMNIHEDEKNKNFYCDVIVDEATKMNRLVKQLLELAQIESGELHIEKTSFSINRLIEQVVKKNSLIFKEKDIRVCVEAGENIDVIADYGKIEQVIANYINNAINHADDEKLIKIKIEKLDAKVRVSVYNSGQHIPEDSLDKIWVSFYKVDKARTRSYCGTGLGLSIVRVIQEAHGNGYGVRNVTGGVEFWFELDAA